MARPPRITPPSAIDGYRRLERARRSGAPDTDAHLEPDESIVDDESRAAFCSAPSRFAGGLRLAGFLAVIAIIIGTSVGLASADPRDRDSGDRDSSEPSAVSTASVDVDEDDDEDVADALADEDVAVAAAATAPTPTPTPTLTTVPATPKTVTRPSDLPFTGGPTLDHLLLAGAALVLLGMLVQIAGQPLNSNVSRVRARGPVSPRG